VQKITCQGDVARRRRKKLTMNYDLERGDTPVTSQKLLTQNVKKISPKIELKMG
jgi:hypothetical protein